PFIIFEIPIGVLADRKLGEKELLNIGLIIVGISTISLSFITIPNIFVWALALFITRVGASIAEPMIETYFFKKVDDRDTAMLGLFRTTRQIGYIVSPIIATFTLLFVDFRYSFFAL